VLDQYSTASTRVHTSTASAPMASTTVFEGSVVEHLRRLLTPEAGLLGQGVRYIIGGCVSVGVYMLTTTLLALVVGLPFEVALAIGFCLMIAVNFTLHRMFVWVHYEGFALSAHRQFGRYISVAGTQYALTAACLAVVPRALGLPTEMVYFATATSFALVTFVAFRHRVFHARASAPEPLGRPGDPR
jgi:putative flippase GtrA